MRFFPTFLLGTFLMLPGVVAHQESGDAQTHLSVRPVQLQSGADASYAIETGEGPWLEGMVFVLYVQFANSARHLNVQLLYGESEVVANWTLESSTRHKLSARIPFTEEPGADAEGVYPYELRFKNLDANQTQFWYFFDQNCNCTAKPIPLDDSWVVFGYDLRKGRTYHFGFPLAATWRVQGVIATLRDERAAYPQDFDLVANETGSGPGWMNFTLKPSATQRHYVFITALDGSPASPSPNQYVEITPLLEEVKGAAGNAAPATIGILAALAILIRRR